MTIVEAAQTVLQQCKTGLTSAEIYKQIIEQGLYTFPAKDPQSVVRNTIRRHCMGLEFPTASVLKHFKIVDYKGKKACYALIESQMVPLTAKADTQTAPTDVLPEEKIQTAYKDHLESVKQHLIEVILKSPPSFFEHLVMDLLLKMGYGYDQSAGHITGGPHDGGIDGIIWEDKLGLDRIYLQAKRYQKEKRVRKKEVQAFIGAMENVSKGVFLTTSSFTQEAKSCTQRQQKNVRLIDGHQLVELMLQHEVGVTVKATIKLFDIDNNYFE